MIVADGVIAWFVRWFWIFTSAATLVSGVACGVSFVRDPDTIMAMCCLSCVSVGLRVLLVDAEV